MQSVGKAAKGAGLYTTKTKNASKKTARVALAGNPNVGKSTVFNSLTGLNQHTGNWPGKTVGCATGKFLYGDTEFTLVDIPGTYSLAASSVEEEIARDYVCFENPDATVIVVDATCLERNLNLVLQTLEITSKVVVCVNLMDEAERKGIWVDTKRLEAELGVPVVGACATKSKGMEALCRAVWEVVSGKIKTNPIRVKYSPITENAISIAQNAASRFLPEGQSGRWAALRLIEDEGSFTDSFFTYLGIAPTDSEALTGALAVAKEYLMKNGIDADAFRDGIVSEIISTAERIAKTAVVFDNDGRDDTDRLADKYLVSKRFGFPIMLLLLCIVLWLTVWGANYPSMLLTKGFAALEKWLYATFISINSPYWLRELLVSGVYKTLAWVVSVMLPPMAIFFPLFTFLEDLGYLPRVAFNLDNYFKKARACGKQALTMCMGFGCNAVGVMGCRIITSPRERLLAIITNSFVPCNGKFPTLIAITAMFFTGAISGFFGSVVSALILTSVIVFGIFMTFVISRFLSSTVLKGLSSGFMLELPPYRKPQLGRIIIKSIKDKTLFVLGRAVSVAAPAGLVIWLMANIYVGENSFLSLSADFLEPFAHLIGLDGYILLAFILGFPANEIVVPLIIMGYMSKGSMVGFESLYELKELFVSNGWTWLTALCVTLFSLMHWPCATTCITIKKETGSLKWTLISFIVPTMAGIFICFAVTIISSLFGLV
ncbi:MAG: Ferrous iron transport protein B [Firmicutes bacterium ADurb.Bin193]|nr:MAG: Ferrous iron transport protein B [Firmicutes bacterium ADurb.Bin193]